MQDLRRSRPSSLPRMMFVLALCDVAVGIVNFHLYGMPIPSGLIGLAPLAVIAVGDDRLTAIRALLAISMGATFSGIGFAVHAVPSDLFALFVRKYPERLVWHAASFMLAAVGYAVVYLKAVRSTAGTFKTVNRRDWLMTFAGAVLAASMWLLWHYQVQAHTGSIMAVAREQIPDYEESGFIVLGVRHYSGSSRAGFRAALFQYSERGMRFVNVDQRFR